MTNSIKNFYDQYYGEERNICLTDEQIKELLDELLFIKDVYTTFNKSIKYIPIAEAVSSKQTFKEFKKCYEEIKEINFLSKDDLFIKALYDNMGDMYSMNIEYCKKLNVLISKELNNTLNLLKQSNKAKSVRESLFYLSFHFAQLYFLGSLMGAYFKQNKSEESHTILMISTEMFFEKVMDIFDTYLKWEEKYE